MSLRKRVAMVVMTAGVLAAQQQAPKQCEPPPGSVRKIIQLQNQPAYKVAQLARGLGLCTAHDDAKQVAVSGPATAIQALEEGLKKTDTPSKGRDLEFIGYILLASDESTGGSEPVPVALDAVIQQLRSVFPYKSYRLLDTLMARQSGNSFRSMEVRSSLPMLRAATDGSRGATCLLQFQIGPVPSESGGRISFDLLSLTINEGDGNTVSIQTSTSIRDGQKVVIGKANGAKLNQTFFLVASPRLVD